MTHVEVQLYGGFREHSKGASVEVTLGEGSTVAELRTAFAAQLGSESARTLLKASVFADDERVLLDTDPLSTGSVLAVLPPVSGG